MYDGLQNRCTTAVLIRPTAEALAKQGFGGKVETAGGERGTNKRHGVVIVGTEVPRKSHADVREAFAMRSVKVPGKRFRMGREAV